MDVNINVAGQKLKIASNLRNYVDGSQKFIRFVFNFSDSNTWDGMIITAQFQQNDNAYDVILDTNNAVYLPTEIVEGKCKLLLYGSKTEVKATTTYLELDIDHNRIVKNASSAALTQTDYEKLVSDVSKKILTEKEDKSNKITAFGSNPTDEQYPSAKLLYEAYMELTESDESINTNLIDIGTLLRDKIAILDTFPTTAPQLFTAYSTKPFFIYSGSTSGDAINGHIYEITRSGTSPNFTYTVTDTGINVGSGGDINGKEDKSNKITEFPENATDTQYPSAKLVQDTFAAMKEEFDESSKNVAGLIRNKIAVLDTFPTTQSQLLLAYSLKPLFIYSGSTSGNAVKGHVYEITRSGTSPNYTYAVTDTGANVDSAEGSATLSKTWVALGDSKTDFNNNGVNRPDNYPYWIQQRNPKITLQNLGSAGGMITNERVETAGSSTILYPSIYTKATQITGTPDIITVAGGYNDWNWAVTLGTFTTDISGYDTSTAANVPSSGATFPLKNTFYMGVFRLAKYLTERFPTTPILWITPFPTRSKNNGGANGWNVCLPLSDYVQAIKDVCAYFSIPVCDMYTAGGLTPFTPSNLNMYWRNSDGVHPNGEGSKIYSYKIERMMRQTYQDWGKTW